MSRFNFKDWKVSEWLYGNKELFKIVIPSLIALCITKQWIDATIAGIISKPILDIVEYYIKK